MELLEKLHPAVDPILQINPRAFDPSAKIPKIQLALEYKFDVIVSLNKVQMDYLPFRHIHPLDSLHSVEVDTLDNSCSPITIFEGMLCETYESMGAPLLFDSDSDFD
jgi:hypothetical protein